MNLENVIITGMWSLWATYSEDIQKLVLERLGSRASQKAKDAAGAAWQRVDWKLSAGKYQQRLQEIYGSIRILGKPEPVSLEGIFTDVVILETPSAFKRYDIKLLHNEPEQLTDKKSRKDGLELVKNSANNRIFILGKPGAGKTTFLKYLTLQAAKGELEKIPIFISLKEWADSELKLMDFLVKQFDICDFPDAQPFVEYILRKGDVLVLFDGLDEVNQEGNQRARMITALRDFSNKYYSAQCLVTCRVAATEYTFDQFVYVELADFSDKQVRTFVKKWFKGSRKKQSLFNEAFIRSENKGLRELARVPLLLSLLCLSFDATLEFPQRRVEIYEEAVEALLKKWDTSRSIKRDEVYHGLSLGRKRQMFARVAAQTFQEGKYFLLQRDLSKLIVEYLRQLPGAEADEEIDGEIVLKAIEAQHGIFTERAHRIYSFSHLTFQEYFTAKQIVADTTGRALRGLLTIENITNDRWREVILLTVSLLDNADNFFEIFVASLSEIASQEPLLVNILKWVEQKLENYSDAAALRGYYCYLILSLISAPSFSAVSEIEDASFSLKYYTYSHSNIIQLCFALAQKLDRLHSLSMVIVQDAIKGVQIAHRELLSNRHFGLDNIPKHLIDLKSDIALHLSYVFFFMLTITNFRDLIDVNPLVGKLRSYIMELRKYANSLPIDPLAIASRDLVIPPNSAPTHTWAGVAEKIQALVKKDADAGPQLTPQQHQIILTFLIASGLLIDCLALAVVSDRAAIEDRLIVSPDNMIRGIA